MSTSRRLPTFCTKVGLSWHNWLARPGVMSRNKQLASPVKTTAPPNKFVRTHGELGAKDRQFLLKVVHIAQPKSLSGEIIWDCIAFST